MKVWLIYVVYQYEGCYDTAVYSTKDKACDEADKLIYKLRDAGYSIVNWCDSGVFSRDTHEHSQCIVLANDYDEVSISVEMKILDERMLI